MDHTINADDVRELLDSCYTAKKITETLPSLPREMKPRHIHVLHAVYRAQNESGCRVSDISRALNTTMPSITKLVAELTEMKCLEKFQNPEDGREVLLKLTPSGMEYVQKYVLDFHNMWADNLQQLTREQVQEAIAVLKLFQKAMPDKL